MDGKLQFLDTLVYRDPDGHLHTSVYRKPTHTNQTLNFNSHHPLHQKLGVVKTLSRRAINICSDEDRLASERKVLDRAFRECGYPTWAIRSGKAPSTHSEPKQDNDCKGYVTIPYIKGISEPISRILSSVGVRPAMKPTNTLKQSLVRPKDRDNTLDQSGVVYQITYEDCPAQYVGQTGRHLRERIKEHQRATEKSYHLESGVAEHVKDTNHQIDWSAKVLDRESNQRRRLVREAIWIKRNRPSMNRETGFKLSKAYNHILQKDGSNTSDWEPSCPTSISTITPSHQIAMRPAI